MSGTALEGAPVVERVSTIRSRIAAAARRAGRDPGAVTLMAASKGQPPQRLRDAFDAGVRVFGESRVQEALAKMQLLPEAEWHFIGPLQTNKARAAAAAFAAFHSVDRTRLAEALDREAVRLGRVLPCFLEVNLAGESTKHGYAPAELLGELPRLASLEAVRWVGLMCIPPAAAEAAVARPWFRALCSLRDRVAAELGPGAFAGWLSMGMSGDFEIAVEEGATHVRIGTDLFGPRPGAA